METQRPEEAGEGGGPAPREQVPDDAQGAQPAGNDAAAVPAGAGAAASGAAPDPAAPPGPAGALDVLYGVLFQPRRTFAALAPRPPLPLALATMVLVGSLDALARAGRVAALLREGPVSLDPVVVVPATVAALMGLSLLLWFVLSALWHLLAELWGGRGTGRATLALVGLAHLPAVLLPPADLLARALGASAGPRAVEAALGVWSLWLAVLAVAQAHRLSTARAFAVIALPLAGVFLVAVAAGAAAAIALLSGWGD